MSTNRIKENMLEPEQPKKRPKEQKKDHDRIGEHEETIGAGINEKAAANMARFRERHKLKTQTPSEAKAPRHAEPEQPKGARPRKKPDILDIDALPKAKPITLKEEPPTPISSFRTPKK